MAASSARSSSSGLDSGMAVATRSMALSLKTPAGRPSASRTISPPSTSGVASSTPAARRAAVLASAMCPSRRLTKTGWSAVTESIHSARGSSPPQLVWSQSPPVIHVPGDTPAAKSPMRRMSSSGVSASLSWTEDSRYPPVRKCTWPSMKPGVTRPPSASRTRVSGPIHGSSSSPDPTATMRSPEIATPPSRTAWPSTPVQTRPPVTTMDAGSGDLVQALVMAEPRRIGSTAVVTGGRIIGSRMGDGRGSGKLAGPVSLCRGTARGSAPPGRARARGAGFRQCDGTRPG